MGAWVWSRVVAEERGTAVVRRKSFHCLHKKTGSLQGSSALLTAWLGDAMLNVVSCLPHIMEERMRATWWWGEMKRELQREGEDGGACRGPVQCNAVRDGTDT